MVPRASSWGATEMKDAEAVTFAGGTLDRATLRRLPDAQAEEIADPEALCLAFWQGRPLVETTEDSVRLGWRPLDDPMFAAASEPPIFLGRDGVAPRFARVIPDWPGASLADPSQPFQAQAPVPHPTLPDRLGFGDLRAVMAALPADEAGTAAEAKGVIGWHATHRFCAMCGAETAPGDGGWRRVCSACGAQHFPRTDPVVIMLILSGEALLVGRSPGWPPDMYSLLAGFMEPGESIEAAVRREVFEESGVKVGRVDYLSSQPWPFPSSLMIGCRGEAHGRAIVLDPAELEDARWINRETAMAALGGNDPALRLARTGSIARFLIERWLSDTLD